jgi:hypothetical protein
LRELLLEYHADPEFLADPAPLYVAGEALIRDGGEARRAVAYVVDDRRTLQPVARQLRAALDEARTRDQAAEERRDKKDGAQAAPETQE